MTYKGLLEWLLERDQLSFWIVFFSLSFLVLLILYLFMSNLRLHFHIRALNRDKERLMEEKDLMRKGLRNSEKR